jgi:hypothetical protein
LRIRYAIPALGAEVHLEGDNHPLLLRGVISGVT